WAPTYRAEDGAAPTPHPRHRGPPDAPPSPERRALLLDWFDPPTESAVRSPEVENTTKTPSTETPSTEDSKDDEEHPPPATPQQSFARSVAGAHPSLRLDRPEENTDIFEID